MLFYLILPLLVTAEWVEISQNNYRKESNHRHFLEQTTAKYNNHSTVVHQWSKGYVQRIPGVSNKRSQGSGSESPVKSESNTFRLHEIITQTHGLDTKITQSKSGNALIERVNHQHVAHHTTPATKIRPQQISYINTSKGDETVTLSPRQNFYMDKKELIKNLGTENRFKTSQINFKEDIDGVLIKIIDDHQTTPDNNNKKIFNNNKFNNGGVKREQTPKGKEKEKTKLNGMETLIKFLKVVSQTINQSAQRSFNGKVRYLEGLKEALLGNIEERINSAFPDDNDEQQRHRRASGTDTHGHVDFPSSESALMTISFLTFAVFLIKLVLQVIHTYKAKTMMVTPAVVATVGRAATIRKKSTRK